MSRFPARNRHAPAARRRAGCRPALELLEDRCCPVTVSGSTPTSIPNSNVHAGDLVTMTATLHSMDPNENGEDPHESLVIQVPGATFTVAAYEETQLFQFQAPANGPTLSAFIPN